MISLAGLVCAVDRATQWAGAPRVTLDAGDLMHSALRRAHRPGLHDGSVCEHLEVFLRCCETEADLNIFGRFATKWDILRCLGNLLRFEAEEERQPKILEEQIVRPIFITGLPRSGTTFLHALFGCDATIQMPRCWQMIFPYPLNGQRGDPRRDRVARQLGFFQRLAPELSTLHPMSADSPQECTEITAQVFQSLRYEMTHRVPSYQKWLDGFGHVGAYRFHRRFLQHLQHQGFRGQWVLKCPDHIHALDAIEAVYPDARFIFVHRDPLRVIPSAAKLTEVVRRPFTRETDSREIGRQVVERAVEAATEMTRRSKQDQTGRIAHLQYRALAADPLGSVESLYRQFGLHLDERTRAQMESYIQSSENNGNGSRYSYEEFGLDERDLCRRFANYMKHFSVSPEANAWGQPGPACAPIAA